MRAVAKRISFLLCLVLDQLSIIISRDSFGNLECGCLRNNFKKKHFQEVEGCNNFCSLSVEKLKT